MKTCGIINEEAQTYFAITMIELGIIIVFLICLIKLCLDRKKAKQKNLIDQQEEQEITKKEERKEGAN